MPGLWSISTMSDVLCRLIPTLPAGSAGASARVKVRNRVWLLGSSSIRSASGTSPWASAACRAAIAASAGFPSCATISALPAVSQVLTSSTFGKCSESQMRHWPSATGCDSTRLMPSSRAPGTAMIVMWTGKRISCVSLSMPSPNASSSRS